MKKLLLFFCVLVTVLFIFTSPLFAFTVEGGQTVNIKEDIEDNLYIYGGAISVRSDINGDLCAVGGRLNLNGDITQDLTAAGVLIYIGGTVHDDVKISGGIVTLNGKVDGEVIIAGGVVVIDSNCHIIGDLVVTGGSLNIVGDIDGRLIALGGAIEILGEIGDDVEIKSVISLKVRKTAKINGDLIYSSFNEASISDDAVITGNVIFNERVVDSSAALEETPDNPALHIGTNKHTANKPAKVLASPGLVIPELKGETSSAVMANKTEGGNCSFWGMVSGMFSGVFAVIFIICKILYFLSMFIFGIILILAIPDVFRRFNDRMKAYPGKCTAGGAVTLFGVPIGITIIWAIGTILLLSIIGAGFSFMLFASAGILGILYLVLVFVSTIFLAYLIGELILSKSKLDLNKYGFRVLAFLIGFAIIEIIYAIPIIGNIAQFAGILLGTGGLAMLIWELYLQNFKSVARQKAGKQAKKIDSKNVKKSKSKGNNGRKY